MTNVVFFGGVNVKNVLNVIRRGERGMNVVAVVSCDSQLDKIHNDMAGRITKVCMWNDRPLVSYSGNVNAKSDEKFTPSERKGFTWLQYPYLEKANKSGVEYLTFSYRDCDKGDYSELYLIDGVEVTKAEAQAYFKPKKSYAPKKQIDAGVTKKEEWSKIVRYEIEKVVYIGSSKDDAIAKYEQFKK
jgi:hypothetical protein